MARGRKEFRWGREGGEKGRAGGRDGGRGFWEGGKGGDERREAETGRKKTSERDAPTQIRAKFLQGGLGFRGRLVSANLWFRNTQIWGYEIGR